jgi:hypothetical protein
VVRDFAGCGLFEKSLSLYMTDSHGASFTANILTSLAPALPASDYYGPSAPSPSHQQTNCLAATGLAGRQVGDPKTVPTFTTDRSTESVPSFPCRPVLGYAAVLHPSPDIQRVEAASLGCRESRRTAIPALIQPVRASPTLFRGFHRWFLHSYTSPAS